MDASAVAAWRCPNCKVCEITGDVPADETRLLYCEMCDRAFTLDLLDPPLISAPTGLFICGQCVKCQKCGKQEEDKKRSSVKYWSRDPRKCFRCGGCKGLVEKHTRGMKCPVCNKIWRKSDDDLVTCITCKRSVHGACDMKAAHALKRRNETSRRESNQESCDVDYYCPYCRKEQEEKAQAALQQIFFREQARTVIKKGSTLVPNEDVSFEELHRILEDEVEWKVREFWREEYKSLTKDGERLLEEAAGAFGKKVGEMLISNGSEWGAPKWMLKRAARWIRYAKRSKKSESNNIRSHFLRAQMASAFLHVACRAMDLNPRKSVKATDRMKLLLIGPENKAGTVHFQFDALKSVGNRQIIGEHEWEEKQYDRCFFEQAVSSKRSAHNNMSDLRAILCREKSQTHPTGDDSSEKANAPKQKEVSKYSLWTKPLVGWKEFDTGSTIPWKDPRTCCLCRTCGDDDGGFSASTAVDCDNLLRVGGTGRLLPMSNGNWVHALCALWSSEVWEDHNDGRIHAMSKAKYRGSKLKCFGCGRAGATLGCHKPNCSFNFHFPCAIASGCVFTTNREMFCRNHISSAQSEIIESVDKEVMRPLKVAVEKDQSTTTADSEETKNSCFRVGSLVVHSLGTIEQDFDGFHSKEYITPPGYTATRIFWSFEKAAKRTVYFLKVERTNEGKPLFSATSADNPQSPIQGRNVHEVYNALLQRVKKTNKSLFSGGDGFSCRPVQRARGKKAFGLSGHQFFGFGFHHIRRALESLPGTVAVAVPLTNKSSKYSFCFRHPDEDDMMDLQRKRAAAAAEKALENSTGSARTEGMKAVARSGGSGRITLGLVRRNPDDEAVTKQNTRKQVHHQRGAVVLGRRTATESKTDIDTNEAKYKEMKSVPLDHRLAAKRSHIHGWGLFTKIDLPKDSMIVEYMGETVRQCIADKRERAYELSGIGSCYMFRMDAERIVDATMIGCMARFMNHSCQANAYARVISVYADLGLEKKLVLFSNRDISAGEEITYDYKFPVEDGSLRCTCGAPNCIGRMN